MAPALQKVGDMEPLTALAALLPLGVEAGKALIQRFIAPDQVKPLTFQDLLELKRLDLELWSKMQAPGENSYPWVAAIRQLQRPLFVTGVLAVWAWQSASSAAPSDTVANMASAVGFYLFGDRTLFYSKK